MMSSWAKAQKACFYNISLTDLLPHPVVLKVECDIPQASICFMLTLLSHW